MWIFQAVFFACLLLPPAWLKIAWSQTDWPAFGHDAGARRYSPLDQINAKNVKQLKLARSFDIEAPLPANAVIPQFGRLPGGDRAAGGWRCDVSFDRL
jgi:hypothetical protein